MQVNDLFDNCNLMIKLTDKDFVGTKLINQRFKHKDGYIMIYAPWCPYCQQKVELWSYLAEQFNQKFGSENFRIAVINSEDPLASSVVSALQVSGIPRFMHVIPDAKGQGNMIDYNGADYSIESLLSEACSQSQEKRLCKFERSKLKP